MALGRNKWEYTLDKETRATYMLILTPEFHLECYDIDDDLWQLTANTINTLIPRMMLPASST